MEIIDLFSNFVAVDYIDLDTAGLQNLCYEVYTHDKGRTISNKGGYQSNSIDLSDQRLQELKFNIERRLSNLAKKIGMKDGLTHEVEEMWLNVNTAWNFNVPHYHDSKFFSGVFYITESNGYFVLKETDGLRSVKLDDNLIQDKNSRYLVDNWLIEPEVNKLIIFPCWMMHYVLPFNSEGERVSLAFNAKIVYPDCR